MTPDDFIKCCVAEKGALLDLFTAPGSGSHVSAQIEKLNLNLEQRQSVRAVLDAALTDTFYTILLALDGAASLGGVQERYSLRDERGTELTGNLEGKAWHAFHGGRREA